MVAIDVVHIHDFCGVTVCMCVNQCNILLMNETRLVCAIPYLKSLAVCLPRATMW